MRLHIEHYFDFFAHKYSVFLHHKFPKSKCFLKLAHNTGNFIEQGTLLTFLPQKKIFFSKCACISSTILTFLPNNSVCFYTKNSQKVNFSSNCVYNTGHFIDFSPKKSDFFLKMRLHIEHYFDFLPNNPVCFYTKNSQKVNFSSNCTIIQGTSLAFYPIIYSVLKNLRGKSLFWEKRQ